MLNTHTRELTLLRPEVSLKEPDYYALGRRLKPSRKPLQASQGASGSIELTSGNKPTAKKSCAQALFTLGLVYDTYRTDKTLRVDYCRSQVFGAYKASCSALEEGREDTSEDSSVDQRATTGDNQMTELPPELKAMNEAMNMVFEAIAAPQAAKLTSAKVTINEPTVAAPRRIDIETAIMQAPDFDYLLASEIFAALHRRLELRYEDSLNSWIAQKMRLLAEEFDHLNGTGK